MDFVEISELVEDREYDMKLRYLVENQGGDSHISEIHIHKLGLLLTGVDVPVHPSRIQVIGITEAKFLEHLGPLGCRDIAEVLIKRGVKCIVIARNLEIPEQFARPLIDARVCLLVTELNSDEFIERAGNFLMAKLAPRKSIHGVLVDVLGVGILLIGDGGIGKSECALDLVHRGHRLVADDLVELVRWRASVIGHCSPLIRHHMEIRGLGVINIQDLYGIAAVREKKRVDMVIELVAWAPDLKLDPLGTDEQVFTVFDVSMPHIKLPVLPGKNLSVIVEVAARNHLLKIGGHDSAKAFQEKLGREIAAVEGFRVRAGEEVE